MQPPGRPAQPLSTLLPTDLFGWRYGSRNKPSEGVAQRIYAKALAIDDNANRRTVIVTLDLIGVAGLRDGVERRVHKRCGAATRVHPAQCFPYPLGTRSVEPWSGRSSLCKSSRLLSTSARGEDRPGHRSGAFPQRSCSALFHACARRLCHESPLTRRTRDRNSPNPDRPVDHDVPVLRVVGSDGNLKAVLFGYACHNTVTGFYTINGDYAGYAQALEQAHPGAVALFLMGAGGDQNPYPRHVSLERV